MAGDRVTREVLDYASCPSMQKKVNIRWPDNTKSYGVLVERLDDNQSRYRISPLGREFFAGEVSARQAGVGNDEP